MSTSLRSGRTNIEVIDWLGEFRPQDFVDSYVQRNAEIANAAEHSDWGRVLEMLQPEDDDPYPMFSVDVNRPRLGDPSWLSPLHLAARGGAPVSVVERLIELGAWRTLRNARGERPVDVAMRAGHAQLVTPLTPVLKRQVRPDALLKMQGHFHELIHEFFSGFTTDDDETDDIVREENLRLPELDPLLEFDEIAMFLQIAGYYGGFRYWLEGGGVDAALRVDLQSRVISGSGESYEITPGGTRMLDAESE